MSQDPQRDEPDPDRDAAASGDRGQPDDGAARAAADMPTDADPDEPHDQGPGDPDSDPTDAPDTDHPRDRSADADDAAEHGPEGGPLAPPQDVEPIPALTNLTVLAGFAVLFSVFATGSLWAVVIGGALLLTGGLWAGYSAGGPSLEGPEPREGETGLDTSDTTAAPAA